MDESYQCLNVSLLGSTGMPTGHEQVCWQYLMFRIFRVVHNGWLELHATVSDSEAVIHLAHVQHLWQSKLFVIFLVLARWRIRLCSELQLARQSTHAFCDACLLEKNCYADELWQQKFLQILHHVLGTKMGVEKWTQKCCQNLTPKMGVQKWHPKNC